MPEIKCSSCKMMVPDDSNICPCCGEKFKVTIPTKLKNNPGWTLPAKIGMAILVLFIIGSFSRGKEHPTPKNINVGTDVTKPAEMTTTKVNKPEIPNIAKIKETEKLTLEGYDFKTSKYGSRYIVGTVRNNTDKEYKYAQISFSLYDSSEAQIGTAWANISNLESGGVWKFEALILKENTVTVKFKGITAF